MWLFIAFAHFSINNRELEFEEGEQIVLNLQQIENLFNHLICASRILCHPQIFHINWTPINPMG